MLEIGNIENHQSDRLTNRISLLHAFRNKLVEIPALWQPGQAVIARHMQDLAVRPNTGRDVLEDENHTAFVTALG